MANHHKRFYLIRLIRLTHIRMCPLSGPSANPFACSSDALLHQDGHPAVQGRHRSTPRACLENLTGWTHLPTARGRNQRSPSPLLVFAKRGWSSKFCPPTELEVRELTSAAEILDFHAQNMPQCQLGVWAHRIPRAGLTPNSGDAGSSRSWELLVLRDLILSDGCRPQVTAPQGSPPTPSERN